MTLDSRARSAVAELKAGPALPDPTLALADLRRRDRSRTRLAATATTAALMVVALVAGLVVRGATMRSTPPVGPAPAPSHSICSSTSAGDAGNCTATARTRIDLKVPVTVTVGAGFTRMYGLPGASMVFFSDSPPARAMEPGVLVQEGAVPIWLDPAVTPRLGYAVTTARDPSAGSTSASVAHWLATRPYLRVTSMSNTTLGGMPAVRLDLQRNDKYAYPYGAFLPVFDANPTWLDTGQEARLWLVDLPDSGLTLIWSSTGLDHADLDKSLPLVESISFG